MTTESTMAGSMRRSMKASACLWGCWILAVGALVHLDWHLGRGHHIPLSLGWPHHWILGLMTGAALSWHVTITGASHAIRRFVLIAALGLFAGQVLEPLYEVIADDLSIAQVYSNGRWRLFGQFTIAFVVGGACVLIAAQRSRMSNRYGVTA